MTEAGSIIGTAQYLSPEQARGAPVDQRSDLYSIGIVLYEMLTGQVPFTGDTPGRDRDEAPLRHAAASLAAAPGHPARPRHGRPARAGEEPGGSLPDRRGDGRGARARRRRRGRDRGDGGCRDGGPLGRGARERSDGDRPAAPTADRGAPLVPLRRSSAEAPRHLAMGTRAAARASRPAWPASTRSARSRTPSAARTRPRCRSSSRARRPRGPEAEQQGARCDRAPATEPDH